MDRKELEQLIERMLDEAAPPAGGPPVDGAVAAARLAAALEPGKPAAAGAGDPTAELAAYLDGGLSAQERDAVEARLAADPAALQELAAAFAHVDAVAAGASSAPASLVDAALARLPREHEGAAQTASGRRVWWSLEPWQWSGAVAVLLLLVGAGTALIGERVPSPFQATPAAPALENAARPAPASLGQGDADAAAAQRDALAARRAADCALASRAREAEAGKMLAVRTPQADASGGAADTCGSASASGSAFDRPAAAAPAALPTPHDFDTGTAGSRR